MSGSAKDLAGSDGVRDGSTTHSDCLAITGWYDKRSAESRSDGIGHISLDAKHTGKPSAGNLHAGFDEAGVGNRLTIRLVRHSQRKRGATDRPSLRGVAPVLDPTKDGRKKQRRTWGLTMSLATPSGVQKLQTASHRTSCVFSESRMREICLSGSMSGNRNQNQVKPD